MRIEKTQRCIVVSRWILKWSVSVLCATILFAETGHAQDFRILRAVGPYSQGVVVENLEMVEPGSLALSIGLNRGNGVLDAIDPPTGRRVVVIDTQLAMDTTLAWQETENLRLHLSLSASHITGNAFGQFEGGGFEIGDTDFGLRWRLLNEEKLGLQLGLYTGLTFPTGDSEQLAGAGATNIQVGALLSQRFDDLTFQGMLGYRHRSKRAQFADASFGNVLDYRAGLYIPLDWPHWLMFTEVAGLLNTTSADLDGTEPAEIFGGVTFGEFTQVSLAYSTGLNEEGGASARRFAMRITHHFGAQERSMTAVVEPANAEIAHFNTERGRESKSPKGAVVLEPSPPVRGNAQAPVASSKTNRPKSDAKSSVPSQGLAVSGSKAALKPVLAIKAPSPAEKHKVLKPSSSAARVDSKVATAVKNLSPQSKVMTKPQSGHAKKTPADKIAQPKSAPATQNITTVSTSKKDTQKVSKQSVIQPTLKRKETVKASPSKATPASISKTSSVSVPLTKPALNALKRPSAAVKPMVTPRVPLSLVYNAAQTTPSNAAFQRLVGEIKAHLKSSPGTTQILVEAYAAPGERAYTPRTHTPQRDAYLLAQTRSNAVLVRLKRAFPKVRFKAAPRIWPSHVVEGNDFWSGVILTPKTGSVSQANQIKTVAHTAQPDLSLMLTLSRPVEPSSVDILTDGLDVVIIRVKGLSEVRKWVKIKHPAVKRALIHPSYETANAGILRVRLNGLLPTKYRDALKVSVKGKVIKVQLPTLRTNAQ